MARDEHGRRECLLDTLLADPTVLACDDGGIVVGDRGRAHVCTPEGRWRSVQGVDWPVGLGSDAFVSVTPAHVIFARRRSPAGGARHTAITRLDRATGAVDELPPLDHAQAISACDTLLAWAPSDPASYLTPTVMFRPLSASEPVARVALPSRASRLSHFGDDLVVVLEQGFAVVRDGTVEVLHSEHHFVQVWPTDGETWYALASGLSISLGSRVERIGASLCRVRGNVLDRLWAEVPPPLDHEFEIGAPTSLATDGARMYFTHAGRVEVVDADGRPVEPVRISNGAH